jgi:hypothetical protein
MTTIEYTTVQAPSRIPDQPCVGLVALSGG